LGVCNTPLLLLSRYMLIDPHLSLTVLTALFLRIDNQLGLAAILCVAFSARGAPISIIRQYIDEPKNIALMRYAARTAAPAALYILALQGKVLRATLINSLEQAFLSRKKCDFSLMNQCVANVPGV